MRKYTDFIEDTNGRALAGASVLVLNYPAGTTATLYSDEGVTLKANPLTTDSTGEFWFYAANGHYTLQISGAGLSPQTITDIDLVDMVEALETAQSVVDSVGTATAAAESAGASATLAQDWATKTSGEVVVGEGYGAKKYSQDASASATAAGNSEAASAGNAANAATAYSNAATVSAAAGAYPNGAGSNVPRGLTQASVGAITAGAGGTNGTFALGWSGGNFTTNPTGTFTVSGGALTAVTITGPGLYIGSSPTVPTPSFSASSGLTGAAVALTAQFLITSGNGYWVTSANGQTLDRYTNASGVATRDTSTASIPSALLVTDPLNKGTFLFGQKTQSYVRGKATTPVAGTATSASTFVYGSPMCCAGAVTGFQFWANGTGTVKIKRFDSTYTEAANLVLNVVAGLNTFTTREIGSFPVAAGDFLGLYSTVAHATVGTCDTRSAYYIGAGDTTTPAHATLLTAQLLEAQFTVSYAPVPSSTEVTNSAFSSRAQAEAKIIHRHGQQGTSFTGGTGGGNGPYLILDSGLRAGRITSFRVNTSAATSIQIYAWDRTAGTNTYVKRTNPLDLFYVPSGYSETALDLPVEEGVKLSVQAGTGMLVDTTKKYPGRGYFSGSVTSVDLDGANLATVGTTPMWGLEVEYRSTVTEAQKHVVSLRTADAITVTGNSFTSGAAQPTRKGWLAIASQMSPWTFYNFAVSANSIGNRLDNIRTNQPLFNGSAAYGNTYGSVGTGSGWRDFRANYSLLVLAANGSPTSVNDEIHDWLETTKAAGAIPILMTERLDYVGASSVYRMAVEQYGGVFIDLSHCGVIFPSSYAGFNYNNGHMSGRVAWAQYGAGLARVIDKAIGKPRNNIKIYRPRAGTSYSNADSLQYDAYDDLRHDLNTKWQEVTVGSISGLGNSALGYMDAVNQTGSYSQDATGVKNEYLDMANGKAASFTDFALLSCHLDAQPNNVREVRIFVGTGHTAVYARSVFHVTTTKIDLTITGNYPTQGTRQGFWHALPVSSDGWATVTEWEVSGKLSCDGRIDFLVEHAGSFTMQSPRVVWWGEGTRTRLIPGQLSRPRGSELVTSPKPYNAGSLASGWTGTNSPTLDTTANGGDLPIGCTGYVRLTGNQVVSTAISGIPSADYGREVEINVWCCAERALIDPATYPTGASMTGDSWDCEQIQVKHTNTGGPVAGAFSTAGNATQKRTLLPYWQEVRLRSWLSAGQTGMSVDLSCATSGAVLVAKASCKLVEA